MATETQQQESYQLGRKWAVEDWAHTDHSDPHADFDAEAQMRCEEADPADWNQFKLGYGDYIEQQRRRTA